jgi:hypothetical protein
MELMEIVEKLKNSFRDKNIKKEVLDYNYYKDNLETGIDSFGFCYYACEVIYKLTGGKEKWKLICIRKSDWKEGGPHIFLKDRKTGEILDITSEQYTLRKIEIPYDLGKGFGLRNVSKKAKKLAKLALEIDL